MNGTTFIIRNRRDKDKLIKDAIFFFCGGQKSLLIKGEGEEISTAVEIAEILKTRLYPGIEIKNISLGSRPFFQHRRQRGNFNNNNYNNNNNNNDKKDIISNIQILLKTM